MRMRFVVLLIVGACLLQASESVQAQFPASGSDSTTSLGQFTIVLNPSFSGALAAASYPGYDPSTNRLTSPLLFDQSTQINRSSPLQVGGPGFNDGTATVGGLSVANSNIAVFPTGPAPAAGTDMVFTQINSFDLAAGPVSVTAGTSAMDASLPRSIGEVTSNNTMGVGNSAGDFPAKSFFDVFVDITVPGPTGGTMGLTNATVGGGMAGTPLLISNSSISSFPPTVIYTHGNSSAVPIFLGPGGIDGHGTDAGDVFGLLTLAGHGVGYTSSDGTNGTASNGPSAFENSYMAMMEAPVPQGGTGQAPQIWFDSSGNPHTGPDPYAPTYSGWGTAADPVTVVTPEPSTVCLLAAFAGTAVAFRLRRRWRRA